MRKRRDEMIEDNRTDLLSERESRRPELGGANLLAFEVRLGESRGEAAALNAADRGVRETEGIGGEKEPKMSTETHLQVHPPHSKRKG